MSNLILIINSGSTSLKFKIFQADNLKEIISGLIERIGQNNSVFYYTENNQQKKINYNAGVKNHETAVRLMVDILPQKVYDQIKIIGQRVVHGGEEFTKPTWLNEQVLKRLEKYNELAPLHNPLNLKTIIACQKHFNEVKHLGFFDTAFFQTLPDYTYLYSLPLKYYEKFGIRKYGFHGLSHQNMLEYASVKLKKKRENLNLITCHLGGGSSITLIKNGKAFDTSMGFTPLEGVTMSTRSGDLDPAVIIYLLKNLKIKIDQVYELLNFESGVFGISGLTDLRDVLIAAGYKVKSYKILRKFNKKEKDRATLALKIYIYDLQRYLSSYGGLVKNLDAIVFSGAIGYHSEIIRKLILEGINFKNKPRILICPPDEEGLMARLIKESIT